MKKSYLYSHLFLFFVLPLNAETNEKKEYDKYDFYAKCLDEALPKRFNTGLVYECSMKSKEMKTIIDASEGFFADSGGCSKFFGYGWD